MRASDVLSAGSTPLTAPAFPAGSHRFTDREYLNIVYRTDADAFRAAVPEPLQVDEPLVRFEVMHMGDVDGFGPYTECGQALACSFGGDLGNPSLDADTVDALSTATEQAYGDDYTALTTGRDRAETAVLSARETGRHGAGTANDQPAQQENPEATR